MWMDIVSWSPPHRCHWQFLDFCSMLTIWWHVWWFGFQKRCISYLAFSAMSFGCLCPCLFVYEVCCAWHLLCFPPSVCPCPQGVWECVGMWGGLENSLWALWLILLGLRKLPSLLSWQSDRIHPHKGDETAAVGMQGFRGPMKEEDKEIMAHGRQMVEVWLEIGFSRNILSSAELEHGHLKPQISQWQVWAISSSIRVTLGSSPLSPCSHLPS